jgi:IS30 family transposase
MIPIAERPFEPDDRTVFGNWEGDLVIGAAGASAVLTLVERMTRFTLLAKVANKTAEEVTRVLERLVGALPAGVFGTITWDQGKELARHADITAATGVPIYFADAHSPWQRGTNENTSTRGASEACALRALAGALRWVFPKGTDFTKVTPAEATSAECWLNTRPMPTLVSAAPSEAGASRAVDWSTPEEAFSREIVALGV